jgi:hypothetical protein
MKINLDLSVHFWIGLVIFVASAISTGTIHLTNAIPDGAIPYVTAWAGILNVIGSGYLTTALALHNASPQAKIEAVQADPGGRNTLINAVAEMPEVKGIVATPAVAKDTDSDKVVATAGEIAAVAPPKAVNK